MSEHHPAEHELVVYDLRCGAVSADSHELAIGVFPHIKPVEAGEIGEKLAKLIPQYTGGLTLQVGLHSIGHTVPPSVRRQSDLHLTPFYTEFVIKGEPGFFIDPERLERLALTVARVIEVGTNGVCASSLGVMNIAGGLSLFERDIDLLPHRTVSQEQLPAA